MIKTISLRVLVLALALYAGFAIAPFGVFYSWTGSITFEPEGTTFTHHSRNRSSFLGEYGAIVREVESGNVVCEASGGPFTYGRWPIRRKIWTVAKWAPSDPRCLELPPGEYFMETCWTAIEPRWGHGAIALARERRGLGANDPKLWFEPVFEAVWSVFPEKSTCETSNVIHVEAKG